MGWLPWPARVRQSARRERGAAALEFGLVAPLLFMVLFGIISYGLWFDDSLNLRQGVREAARQAVIGDFGGPTGCLTSYTFTPSSDDPSDMEKLVCQTKEQVSAITGTTYVKVSAPNGWAIGNELLVCAMVKATALPGIVPLPSNRIITSSARMAIEDADPGQLEPTLQETPPTGADWSWCTP